MIEERESSSKERENEREKEREKQRAFWRTRALKKYYHYVLLSSSRG